MCGIGYCSLQDVPESGENPQDWNTIEGLLENKIHKGYSWIYEPVRCHRHQGGKETSFFLLISSRECAVFPSRLSVRLPAHLTSVRRSLTAFILEQRTASVGGQPQERNRRVGAVVVLVRGRGYL